MKWNPIVFNREGLPNLYAEQTGNALAPAVLLVPGLSTQLTMWTEEFCLSWLDQGFQVIRMDNRDCGLSGVLENPKPFSLEVSVLSKVLGSSFTGPSNYDLVDMAEDVINLANYLSLERFALVGASMGGMIAQIVAAKYPKRVVSLGLIMTTSGSAQLPSPSIEALTEMFMSKAKDSSLEAKAARYAKLTHFFAGPLESLDPDAVMQQCLQDVTRFHNLRASYRQLHAVVSTGSIETRFTRKIKCPVLIVHGLSDPLLPKECALRLNRNIDSSNLVFIREMGHHLQKGVGQICAKFHAEFYSDHHAPHCSRALKKAA